MRSPIEFFFKLGDWATKGDVERKANFDYTFLWVIFLAFLTVLIGNLINFVQTKQISYLGWTLVIFGILWFQYFSLKAHRDMRKMKKAMQKKPEETPQDGTKEKKEEPKFDNLKDMLGEFK